MEGTNGVCENGWELGIVFEAVEDIPILNLDYLYQDNYQWEHTFYKACEPKESPHLPTRAVNSLHTLTASRETVNCYVS